MKISAMMLGPKDSILPAPKLARIREPNKLVTVRALKLQIVPPRKMSIDIMMTGLLPMHMANGIQTKFEIPSANTDHETRSIKGAKLTWNSPAMASKPVVMPAYMDSVLGSFKGIRIIGNKGYVPSNSSP